MIEPTKHQQPAPGSRCSRPAQQCKGKKYRGVFNRGTFAAGVGAEPGPIGQPITWRYAADPAIVRTGAVDRRALRKSGSGRADPASAGSPAVIQDPTATATPQAVQWTSANGLTTTGIMNPFGLTQNNPAIGFFGAAIK